MIEEIKEDNNCIVKAFENNPISILKEDDGDKKVYYFKASDIGKALNLSNVRVSIQNFDEDEQVVRKAYTLGGQQDTLFLSSQGVYRLLYNSKKEVAKKFRKWAGAILDDIIFNESKELQRQLQEKEIELNRTKKQLELTAKLQVKKWFDTEPGHTIYALKNNSDDPNSLITIGKSKKIAERESNYFTHNQNSDMFFIRKCYNCDLAEKVLHHMLDKYRIDRTRDESIRFDSFAWFNISENLAKYIINLVCDFLDNFISSIEKLPNTNLQNEIHIVSKELGNKLKSKEDNFNKNIENNLVKRKTEIQFNELNYDKFIDDFCETSEEYYSIPEEILGAYKLWSRINVDTNRKNLLFDYIKTKFQMKKMYYEKYKARINTFVGIRPKIINWEISNDSLKSFLKEKCDIGYIYKITEKDFIDNYTSWINRELNSDELINIKAELNNNFYYGNINYSKEKKKYGYVGFKLKGSVETIHCLRNKNTKKINKVNIHTKEIEETFISINEASNKLNINIRTIQFYLKLQKVFDECYVLHYEN
jgi:prophage antirepressor-like protein